MNDLKYALRMLRKNPGFTTVAILTLAIGIGATTTVFSIVNGVLLQPLEYPDSDRIVYVWEADKEKGFQFNRSSPANFLDWRRENDVFEAIAFDAFHSGPVTRSFIHQDDGRAERLPGRFVSTDYFKVFGQEPLLGRTFGPEEEKRGSARVTVISHRLWQRLYNGDREIVGKPINLENQGRHSYQIVGVMPEGFRYPNVDIWIPCAHMPRDMTRRGGHMINVVARLKDGVSLIQAQTAMDSIQGRIHERHGHLVKTAPHLIIGRQVNLQPMLESVVAGIRPSLIIFCGAVALVLLIACANVANLLLSRALARQREMSIRAALGAGRARLVRQLLSESAALSFVGGLAGILVAWGGTKLVIQFGAGSIPRLGTVTLDWRVLGFALLASIITGVIFGLAPAWQSSKTDLTNALKEGAGRVTGSQLTLRLRSAFTVTQVALALMLLIGAGLLIQSFNRLQDVKPGFDTAELLVVELSMTSASHKNTQQRRAFLRNLLNKLGTSTGVASASAVSMIPDRRGWPYPYTRNDIAKPPAGDWNKAGVRYISPDYLQTFGIPLLRGREFAGSDTAKSEKVMMINQAFAKSVFPGEDPLGKQLTCANRIWRIVGVFGDVKNSGRTQDTVPEMCMPAEQWEFDAIFLTVRAESNPLALAPIISDHVHTLDAGLPLNRFRTMKSYLDQTATGPRFRSMLLGMFALAALILASVGIYGVMAYAVSQRTNEMGIRMALGAQKSEVMSLIIRQGMRLTLIGVALGLTGSYAVTRVLESHLFNITATDLQTFLGVSLLLTLVALAACLAPAIRAMRTSPAEALRYE
jgi:putative ABC transport system permease protein